MISNYAAAITEAKEGTNPPKVDNTPAGTNDCEGITFWKLATSLATSRAKDVTVLTKLVALIVLINCLTSTQSTLGMLWIISITRRNQYAPGNFKDQFFSL